MAVYAVGTLLKAVPHSKRIDLHSIYSYLHIYKTYEQVLHMIVDIGSLWFSYIKSICLVH